MEYKLIHTKIRTYKDQPASGRYKRKCYLGVEGKFLRGQATLEYILLFIAVTVGITLGSRAFFTFDGKGTGEAKNIAEEAFTDKAEEILGYNL